MSNEAKTFAETGIFHAKGLFTDAECDFLTNHFMGLRETARPGDFDGVDLTSTDPLKKFPRMIHMHRWDEISMKWALDQRIADMMTKLLGEEPYMVQTMLYFKPAGARGQALHQDQAFLRAKPGTCVAAWLALDDCDEENGCMQIVKGTQDLPILCTVRADTSKSFTDVTVPVPEGYEIAPAIMKRGDVLFFNGSVIHGSYPNTSSTRFRRALIGHYITGNAEKVGAFYSPAYRMNGTQVEFENSPEGGPCGRWVDNDGELAVAMSAPEAHDRVARHE